MSEQGAVVRIWTGVIRSTDRDAYVDYVRRTGVEQYRETPGNLDAWIVTRDLGDERTEISTISRWVSLAAIEAFAGQDLERAVYYPEDDAYLLERDERVRHFRVEDA